MNGLPKHIAVIMDGNGRWARSRLLPRYVGHREGGCTQLLGEIHCPFVRPIPDQDPPDGWAHASMCCYEMRGQTSGTDHQQHLGVLSRKEPRTQCGIAGRLAVREGGPICDGDR